MMPRCGWAGTDPIYVEYHDKEWGVPEHDDRRLFESLVLDGAQAGLSWITILKKRSAFRKAFAGFEPSRVARFGERDIQRLVVNSSIIRNRAKIASAITNARCTLAVQNDFGSFDAYIWRFVGGAEPKQNHWRDLSQVPAMTPESEAMSKDLKGRGFAFVGPTICYAFMQAMGMVNDHVVTCFRHRMLQPRRFAT